MRILRGIVTGRLAVALLLATSVVGTTAAHGRLPHGIRAEKATLDQDATFLLMEGLRRIDESSQRESAAS